MEKMKVTRAEQERLLKAQREFARKNSLFYKEERDFTAPEDIRLDPLRFLCVPPNKIARVITLKTSGSTEAPKRIFFTENDLQKTEDFFYCGMRPMVRPGETAAVFMGGASVYSVGGLLKKALNRFGASALTAGFLSENGGKTEAAEKAACLIGTPAEMAYLAKIKPGLRPKTVLLSGERVPIGLRKRLENIWGAEIFTHWGMCETGYGGAVEQEDHAGLVIRNDSFLIEITDPETGAVLPCGMSGEIVFSTLNREGMPLLRYRTGDWGRLLRIEGEELPRLDTRIERLAGRKKLSDGSILSPLEIDELAFSFPQVTDCRAELNEDSLTVTLRGTAAGLKEQIKEKYPALTVSVRETEQLLPFTHGKRSPDIGCSYMFKCENEAT